MSHQPPPGLHRASEASEYFFSREGCHVLEIWNRDQDDRISVARVRVDPGATTRLHSLRGIAERYLILAGQGILMLGDLPAEHTRAGDLLYIPPDCPQSIRNPGSDDLIFLALCTPRFVLDAYRDLAQVPSPEFPR